MGGSAADRARTVRERLLGPPLRYKIPLALLGGISLRVLGLGGVTGGASGGMCLAPLEGGAGDEAGGDGGGWGVGVVELVGDGLVGIGMAEQEA